MIYLDHAATTPVPRAVADAMYEVLTEQFGNPSSQYPLGLEMKRRVESWRRTIAGALGCDARQLFFTSCGTEADNWAVTAACWQNRHVGRHIVTTAVEHSAVLEACRWMERQGYEVTYLAPAQDGSITAEQVLDAVRPDTALVSVMLVNNELGNVYPIADIARGLAAKNPKALLHTDAVQGFLKVPFTARSLGADFITISAHKIGGPKGIGALYIGQRVKNPKTLLHTDAVQGFLKVPFSAKALGADFVTISAHKIGGPKGIGALYIGPRVRNPKPLLAGGEQESGLRAGTEATAQIAGFAKAAELRLENLEDKLRHMARIRDYAVERLTAIPDLKVLSAPGGAPHVLSVSLVGWPSQNIVNDLGQQGICISAGSACHQGKPSHVIAALKLPKRVSGGVIRLSFGPETAAADIDACAEALQRHHDTRMPML